MSLLRLPTRIANKIILLVLLLELGSLSLWGSLTYTASRQELLNTISAQLSEVAFRTTSEIGNFFLPIRLHLDGLATLLQSTEPAGTTRDALFHRLLRDRPEVEEISLIAADGTELAWFSRMHGRSHGEPRPLDSDVALQNAILGERGRGPIQFSNYFEPQVELAIPVGERPHEQSGEALLALINLKWLWDIVQSQRIGEHGYVYVVDEHLKLIAHPDPSFVLSETRMRDSQTPLELFQGQGQQTLLLYKNLNGVAVAGVSRFDPTNNWWVVVEQPVEEGLAPLNRVIQRFLSALVLAALITVTIVLVFARVTMRPLESLRNHIEQQAAGARDVRMPVPNDTELASLAQAFNSMAASLDRQFHELHASQAALQQSHEQVQLLLNSTAEAIFGIDLQGNCTFCNPAALRCLGYETPQELIGANIHRAVHYAHEDGSPRAPQDSLMSEPGTEGGHFADTVLWRKDGSCFHAECWVHPMYQQGESVGAVVTFVDITERRAYTEALEYTATHDDLTGLPNRQFLYERLTRELEVPYIGNDLKLALLLIDLDHFKEINDGLGHRAGDTVLTALGPRLQKLLGDDDLVARLGGDEFAIVLSKPGSQEAAEQMARELIEAIERPFALERSQVQLGASIGIALSPQHGHTAGTLMRCADVAMYHAKHSFIDYVVYQAAIDTHSPRRLALINDLRGAIANGELTLHYQPKIHIGQGSVVAVEALARWDHPQHGRIAPAEFVPIAELGGMIHALTDWVIERAVRDYHRIRKAMGSVRVAINISARNLQDGELPGRVERLLKQHKLTPDCLQMELTESAIMTDPLRTRQIIARLAQMGIEVAIDDFGTGYSSLAYLKQLPVHELKIDKSFVLDMERDESDTVIVHSTINLAHHLGKKVTAEGVESQGMWDLLAVLGCDLAQGYYMCKPQPLDELIAWSKGGRGLIDAS